MEWNFITWYDSSICRMYCYTRKLFYADHAYKRICIVFLTGALTHFFHVFYFRSSVVLSLPDRPIMLIVRKLLCLD